MVGPRNGAPASRPPRYVLACVLLWSAAAIGARSMSEFLSSIPGVVGIVLVDPNLALARSLQTSFPAAIICSSIEKALPLVDAVVIATPPQSHARLALAALRAGKHTLVEKPLATCLDDAKKLVEEAQLSNTVLMVGHTFQFNPAIRELRRRLRAGEFGQIYYIHSARLNLGLYRPT